MQRQIRKLGSVNVLVTQQIADFPSIRDTRDEARAFAAENVKALAAELIQWQDSGLLPDGKLRELAAIWAKADESNSMSLAESAATRAALDAVASS